MFTAISFQPGTWLSWEPDLGTPLNFVSFFLLFFFQNFVLTKAKILCVAGLTWDPIRRSPLTRTKNLCGWANLRSYLAIPFNQNQNLRSWANLRSHPTIPFNQNQYTVCGWANLRSHLAIPFNQNQNLYGWVIST